MCMPSDAQVGKAGVWPDDGKEYYPANLHRAWEVLTGLFCDPVRYWNVFAADLRNEPHGMVSAQDLSARAPDRPAPDPT